QSPPCHLRHSREARIPTKHAVRKHGELVGRAPSRFAPLRRLSSVAVPMVGVLKLDCNTLLLATDK
ncbi:MAG: hypothetical protein Q8S13_09200, partial [Dehalococcoidia bacterium]|nr:hypothetical protein [Dehalococcoidia bacterium]